MQYPPSPPLIPVQAVTLVMALDIDLDAPGVDIDLEAMEAARNLELGRTTALWRTQPAVHHRDMSS